MYDKDYYCTQILGLVSEGKKGRIFKNWKTISNEEFNNLPYNSYYGLDYGYSNDPNACIEVKQHNRTLYIKGLLYEGQLSNIKIAEKLKAKGVGYRNVYADSAEPKSNFELANEELNIISALKGADSVQSGINELQQLKIYYVPDTNLEFEYQEYRWALDKNNEPTNKPEDKNNHYFDALRYAYHTHNFYNSEGVTSYD